MASQFGGTEVAPAPASSGSQFGGVPVFADSPDQPQTLADALQHQGFLESAWNSLKGLVTGTAGAFTGEYSRQTQEQLRRAKELAQSGTPEQRRDFAQEVLLTNIPFASTVFKAVQGNLPGAAGDIAGLAAIPLAVKGVQVAPRVGSAITDWATGPGNVRIAKGTGEITAGLGTAAAGHPIIGGGVVVRGIGNLAKGLAERRAAIPVDPLLESIAQWQGQSYADMTPQQQAGVQSTAQFLRSQQPTAAGPRSPAWEGVDRPEAAAPAAVEPIPSDLPSGRAAGGIANQVIPTTVERPGPLWQGPVVPSGQPLPVAVESIPSDLPSGRTIPSAEERAARASQPAPARAAVTDAETLDRIARGLAGKSYARLTQEQQKTVWQVASRLEESVPETPPPPPPPPANPAARIDIGPPSPQAPPLSEQVDAELASRRAAGIQPAQPFPGNVVLGPGRPLAASEAPPPPQPPTPAPEAPIAGPRTAEEATAFNRTNKAARFVDALQKSGITATALKNIEPGYVSQSQIAQGMPPRWGNIAEFLGENEPSADTIAEISRQMRQSKGKAALENAVAKAKEANAAAKAKLTPQAEPAAAIPSLPESPVIPPGNVIFPGEQPAVLRNPEAAGYAAQIAEQLQMPGEPAPTTVATSPTEPMRTGSMAQSLSPEWHRYTELQALRRPLTDAEWEEFQALENNPKTWIGTSQEAPAQQPVTSPGKTALENAVAKKKASVSASKAKLSPQPATPATAPEPVATPATAPEAAPEAVPEAPATPASPESPAPPNALQQASIKNKEAIAVRKAKLTGGTAQPPEPAQTESSPGLVRAYLESLNKRLRSKAPTSQEYADLLQEAEDYHASTNLQTPSNYEYAQGMMRDAWIRRNDAIAAHNALKAKLTPKAPEVQPVETKADTVEFGKERTNSGKREFTAHGMMADGSPSGERVQIRQGQNGYTVERSFYETPPGPENRYGRTKTQTIGDTAYTKAEARQVAEAYLKGEPHPFAGIEEGLPIAEHKPGKGQIKFEANRFTGDGFVHNTVDGEEAWTNGHVMFKGKAPGPLSTLEKQPDISRVWQDAKNNSERQFDPIGVYRQNGKTHVVLRSADGKTVTLAGDYYDFVNKRIPDAIFRGTDGKSSVTVWKPMNPAEGTPPEMMGVIAPMRASVQDMPAGIQKLLKRGQK